MSKVDPQYSPLLQGEWSEEEEGMLAKEGPDRDLEKKGGLPFPKPYKHERTSRQMKPLHVFLAIVGVISAGVLIAIIAGVIRSHMDEPSHPANKPHPVGNKTQSHHVQHMSETVSMTTSATVTAAPKTVSPETIKIQPPHVAFSRNWRIVLNSTGTESCVRTPDIDGDGLPDVLVGVAHEVDLDLVNALDEGNSLKKYCEDHNRTYPCVGFLLALRGYDGKELWRIPTRSEVLFMMCDIDLNGDGHKDCVASGRQSTTHGVDLINGKTLWYADGTEHRSHFKQMWNVYQALPLPDIDGDGVLDILVAHGGDPNIDAEIHDRKAGRLIVLSGATGRPLGDYYEMPNSRETYMTPVMYTATDGSKYILFGSGGETVPGDLMAMTLPDLLKLTNQKAELNLPGQYAWTNILDLHSGIMVMHSGKKKGVMVPPVIIDNDNDGVDDILVSVFDGSMIMKDGKTLTNKWTATFPDSESYSTPAPGYFDDDEYLDFMLHWSVGGWPDYNESVVVILSGKNGSTLWEERRPLYVMSSDLVLRSQEDRLDYFLVKMRGKNSSIGSVMRSEAHGVGAQRNISKRSTDDGDAQDDCAVMAEEFKKDHVTCDKDLTTMGEGMYIINRNTVKNNLPFQETLPQKFRYTYKPKPDEKSCVPVDKDTGKVHLCIVMVPESRSTDAVTDVDNDGRLDLIYLGILEGRVRDSRYSYSQMQFSTIISRTDLETIVRGKSTTNTGERNTFRPLSSQPWLQYLGSATSSVYHRSSHVKH